MQVRKLIWLLNEFVKERPSNKYRTVCLDSRYARSRTDLNYIEVNDIHSQWTIWEPDDSFDSEKQRHIVAIGSY